MEGYGRKEDDESSEGSVSNRNDFAESLSLSSLLDSSVISRHCFLRLISDPSDLRHL